MKKHFKENFGCWIRTFRFDTVAFAKSGSIGIWMLIKKIELHVGLILLEVGDELLGNYV